MFRSSIARVVAAAAATLAGASGAQAAEYVLTPSVEQRFDYNGNMLNQQVIEVESFGYTLTPALRIESNTPTWRLRGDASGSFRRFEEDQFNSDDQYMSFSVGNFTDKRQIQFFAGVDRESFRTSQQDITGDPGTGRVVHSRARPVAYWQLSERNGLTVGGSWDQVNYDDLDYDDYKNYSVDLTFARQLSERMIVEVSGIASDYQATPAITSFAGFCQGTIGSIGFSPTINFGAQVAERSARTYGLQVGLRRAVSESLQWSVSVGGRDVENEQDIETCTGTRLSIFEVALTPGMASVSDDDNGFSGSTSLSYTGDRFTTEVSFEQSVSPAALGFLLDTKSLQARGTYKLTERLSAGVQFLRSDSESVSIGQDYERDFWTLTGTLNWRVTPKWQVLFGARTRDQERRLQQPSTGLAPSIPQITEAEAATAFIEIKYTANPISVSR